MVNADRMTKILSIFFLLILNFIVTKMRGEIAVSFQIYQKLRDL